MLSWFFAVAVSGLLIMATWWAFHSGLTKTEVRLADGRQVVFKGLTSGQNTPGLAENSSGIRFED